MLIRLFAYDVMDDMVWTVVMQDTESGRAHPVLVGEGTVPRHYSRTMSGEVWSVLVAAAQSAHELYEKDPEAQKAQF
jgi:hypothetical protein